MRLFGIILKTVLLIPAVYILAVLCDFHQTKAEYKGLYQLPEYNYIPEVKALIYRNCFGEAEELCRDIIRMKLPGAEEAKVLRRLCENEKNSARWRLGRTAKGFITGSSGSLEEAGGALVSDLIIYGDIRDLLMQGYFKITGQETDTLIVLLSAAGLTTSLIQTADWLPASMKLLAKTGAVTAQLRRTMTGMLRSCLKSGKALPRTVQCFRNLTVLLKLNSFPRAVRFMRYIKTPKELELYKRLSMSSASSSAYLILISSGEQGARAIRRFGSSNKGLSLLRAAARRGAAGAAWLGRHRIVRTVKWGARISKILHTGRAYDFLRHTMNVLPASRWIFLAAALMLLLYSSTLILEFRPKRKKISQEESGEKEAAAS